MTAHRDPHEAELSIERERELELALRAAYAPSDIDVARHERILELALEDPLAEPSPAEVLESERLRRALEGDGDHPDLDLVRALASAAPPEKRVAKEPRLPELPSAPRRPGRVIFIAFGAAASALSAAAAVALLFGVLSRGEEVAASRSSPASAPTLSRSSAGLFNERFTLEQTTARVDRIAEVRERELRQNLYRSWGVR